MKSEGAAKHLPPLVAELRTKVKAWRDSGFELEFAGFLENCEDIISYARNYFAVNLKID